MSRRLAPLRQIPLWSLALFSWLGYGVISFWFPLRPHYQQLPLQDIYSLGPTMGRALAYAGLLLLLFGLYLLAYRRVRQGALRRQWLLFVAPLLFSLPLLFTYPYTSTDIFRYFLGGRITAFYGESPFFTPPSAFTDDSQMRLAGEWIDDTSPYGPVWEGTAAAVVFISGNDLLRGLLLLKGLAAALHLALGGLIWLLLAGQEPARRAARTLLWTWNPALLLIFVVNGHNDVLMLFWLLLGFGLQQRGRPAAGLIVMTLAPLSKAIALLALPFFWLAAWRQLPDTAARWFTLLAALAGSLALTAVTFRPFGSPLALAQRLLSEAAEGPGFSPATLWLLILQRLERPLPIQQMSLAGLLLLGTVALWLLWRAWHGRPALRGVADILAVYLVQALRFRIWYTSWLLPWLLLDAPREHGRERERADFRLIAAIGFLLTAQLSPLIYGHWRIFYFQRDHLPAHLVGVPFVFILPWLLALAANGYRKRSGAPQTEK